MGNHDERGPFREGLLDEEPSDEPVHRVLHVGGLRVIALDTSVPGFHHGELDATSLAWLDEVLAEPAAEGTIIAMHHAPLPTALALMDLLELRGQDDFADVIRDRDVRLILGGHLHYATNGSFAGFPSPSPARRPTRWTSPRRRASSSGSTVVLVHARHLYDDSFVTSVVPVGPSPWSRASGRNSSPKSRHSHPRGVWSASRAAPSRLVTSTGCAARARPAARGGHRGAGWRRDLDRLLDEYLVHVRAERGFSEHTVSAYRADLADLIGFANDRGTSTTPAPSIWACFATGCGRPRSRTRAHEHRAARGIRSRLHRRGGTDAS